MFVLVATGVGLFVIWWVLEVYGLEPPDVVDDQMAWIPPAILVGGIMGAAIVTLVIFLIRRRAARAG
ncbi:hypothetical protein [Actinomadura sp. B10D3]|uniref:hypothetical protein n=1 Tax=Actinomadura sp. B10D3 TaxID=3153557 RepID=UPI00325EEDAA